MLNIRDARALMAELGSVIKTHVSEAVAPLHARIAELEAVAPVPGEKGDPGDPGKDADPVDTAALAALVVTDVSRQIADVIDHKVSGAVREYMIANPVSDGKDGAPGDKGDPGEKGDPGPPGKDGADGAGLADALIDREGALVITMTDGRAKSLGVVVGRDGDPGKDGDDGLDFDDVSGQMDPERGYVLRMSKGDRAKELVLPYMHHIGFWREGMSAKAGELTTHNGNLWWARRETKAAPSLEAVEDWTMAARKGRDGSPGKSPPEPKGTLSLKGKRDA